MLLFAKFVTHNYNKVITEPNHNSMRDSFMRKSGVTATLMAFLMLLTLVSCRKEPAQQEEVPVLKVSETALSFAGNGDVKSVTVETSGTWIAKAGVDWVSLTPENGAGTKTVTVKAQVNPNAAQRTGKIEFYLTAYPDVKAEVSLTQAEKGASAPDPEKPEDDGPDNSSVVIPREDFTEESSWSVTGSIMELAWSKDIVMLEEPAYGWLAAFDVTVASGEEFKFRKDADWAVNLGGTNKGQTLRIWGQTLRLADFDAEAVLVVLRRPEIAPGEGVAFQHWRP